MKKSKADTCETCDAFERINPNGGLCHDGPPAVNLYPRMAPPQMVKGTLVPGDVELRAGGDFPPVANGFWCRRHKPAGVIES